VIFLIKRMSIPFVNRIVGRIKRIPLPVLIVISIVVILVVAVAATKLYISVVVGPVKNVTVVQGKPSIQAYLTQQNLLYYNQSTFFIPYALFGYSVRNVSVLNFNVSLYKQPVPTAVYLLNFTNECLNCNGVYTVINSTANALSGYGLQYNLTVVSQSYLPGIEDNSILVVLNGLLPSYILGGPSNNTVLQQLLNRGISIIYIGQNFSRLLEPGDIIVPNRRGAPEIPTASPKIVHKNPFYFSNVTFSFFDGFQYGSATYTNVANGSVVAFSNYLSAWPNPTAAGLDIAKAIAQLFWLPKYSSGSAHVTINSNFASGNFGALLDSTPVNVTTKMTAVLGALNSGSGRAVVSTSSNYSLGSGSVYQYVYYKPSYSINGNLSMTNIIIPGIGTYLNLEISTNSPNPIYIRPHLTIYAANRSTQVLSIPLPYTQITGNFSFIKPISFLLPPGVYIASLQNFSNNQYAAAYFKVPDVNITLKSANYSANRYRFYLSMLGTPVSGFPYKVLLNNEYQANGTIENGTIDYALPKGLPQIYGELNFSFDILSTHFEFAATNPAPVITINAQYIEIAVVAVIVLLLTTVVRAPQTDEFYIDVPNLPRKEVTEIKLSPATLTGVFDKLNSYYHWRYMPLNPNEVRIGVANSIRYKGMPVNLTFSNVEFLLDQLVQKGELTNLEYLYTPKQWITQSGHDIEYLAIFKKLRMYFVTHALVFTDLDANPAADMVVALRDEHVYVVIYSETSKFKNMPVYENSITYLTFLNADKLETFRKTLYKASSRDAELLKMYMSSGRVRLLDADNPETLLV